MTATFADTNVLIDVYSADSEWHEWSLQALVAARREGTVHINVIVYAELAAGRGSRETLESFLTRLCIEALAIPWQAAFLAGQAFARYRARGGPRDRLLADFLIGAHAQVAGMRLLTRDARRYRGAFDTLELVAPESASP